MCDLDGFRAYGTRKCSTGRALQRWYLRDYFWATAALYGFSWFARVIRTFFNGVPSGVTYEALPDDMVKITVPTKVSWRAGQHFFIRFLDLGIHAASSHPFTVASLPDASDKGGQHIIELYARVQGGITARLDAVAKNSTLKMSSVLLDGPYGGLEGNLHVYDRALLLGGGSGITFVVPLLLDLVRSYESGKTQCSKVHLVWAARTTDTLSWFEAVLEDAIGRSPKEMSISIAYYVTAATVDDHVGGKDESDPPHTISRHLGRPDLGLIVRQFCNESGSAAVAVCGPASFGFDTGKAVSQCELAIVQGNIACSEIYMHQESYGW
ncbi:hypothetical protein EIP86_000822 [Pleurotus ostreatoroseus]|nr:hypothetical protein EIP86_000822 [Pleurotus ostreatoroseus]